MLRKGMFIADRYEILEQIGTGGMSDVYKAKCHKLNRCVAVKVLKKEFSIDKNFVSKFRAEAQSAAGLIHPNIVNVYDVGDENGIYYIVMELVEGITLKKYIEKRGKIPYKEAISIALQIAKGMEAAHNNNIIHRDIKPQNIIISKEGKVKVTDFGIAKVATSNTINSSTMGSVHYISPEQARIGFSDARSDIYSFGITLFEMITGKVPFDGDSTVAVAVKQIRDPLPKPSSMVEGIPISVDKIIMKCAQKKTERRYQTVSELVTDLKKALVMPEEDFVKLETDDDFKAHNNANEDSNAAFDPNVVSAAIMADALNDGIDEVKAAENNTSKTAADAIENNSGDILSDTLTDTNLGDTDLLADDFDEEDIDLDVPSESKPKANKAEKAAVVGSKLKDVMAKNAEKNDKKEQNPDEDDDEYEDEEDDNRLDKIMKWIGIGIVALILVITAFVAVNIIGKKSRPAIEEETTSEQNILTLADNSSNNNNDSSEKVSVPKLTGLSEDDARQQLDELGLGCKVVSQTSSTVAQGMVISQGTTEGTMVSKNTTITLSVSSGEASVVVPNVVKKAQIDASSEIENAGFKVSILKAKSDSVDAGYVIEQNPSGGSSATPGTTITITISEGKEVSKNITVPNVFGLDEGTARQKLESNGLKVNVKETTSVNKPYGQVISQSVDAGTTVDAGSTITITVSRNQSYEQGQQQTTKADSNNNNNNASSSAANNDNDKPTKGNN